MFFGFEYKDGKNTTTGTINTDPGRYHGRLSIAGNAVAFQTKQDRDNWVAKGCNSYGGREAVSIRRLRYLCKGMTAKGFSEYLETVKEYYL